VVLSRQSRIKTSAITAGATLVVFAVAATMLLLLGLSTGTAVTFAAIVACLHATYVGIHLLTITSGWFPGAARAWLLAVVWATMIGVAGCAVSTAFTGGLGLVPVLLGAGFAAVALPLVHRTAVAGVTSGSPLPAQVRTMRAAEATAAAAAMDVRLADPKLNPANRAAAEIQRAAAQTALAFHAGQPERLGEIVELLQRHARNAVLPHGVRLAAACGLIEARDVQAEVTRDDHGWPEALALQQSIATAADAEPWERGRALFDAGDYQVFLMRTAVERGDDPREPAQAAYSYFRQALAVFGEDAGYTPLVRVRIAQQAFALAMIDPGSHQMSVAAEIHELRQALPLFHGKRREGREIVELTLAQLLLLEADQEERLTPGLAEAEAIGASLVANRRMAEIAGSAHEVLADAARLRLELTPQPSPEQRRTLRGRRIQHLRLAFDAHTALSIVDAATPGLVWARAVAAEGDATAAADAYASLVAQVNVETLRRLDYGDRAAFVANFQGTATEAGRWLSAAGRLAEAVEAIESARAILLGQRAARLPDDLMGRLHRAGRGDLYAAYADAAADLDRQERSLHAHGDRAAAHRARSAFDHVRREVADILGSVAGSALPAARAVAPLVYVGVAEQGGYAIAFAADGRMAMRELPDATPQALATQLDAYRLVQDRRAPAAGPGSLDSILEWAWAAVMAPIVDLLPRDAPVTMVPLGGLGVLPLHAAGGPHRGIDDVATIRYAPSARMAAQARRDAELADRRPRYLVAVSVPNLPSAQSLPFAEVEALAISRLATSVHLRDATRADVLGTLPTATVWHFACHGTADIAEPLKSRLSLADGDLTVRDILALPASSHRLAVLSACETAIPDAARLDEVISLPGALLQAGVAGVVAAGWPVSDRAAAAFAIHFHQLLADGVEPAQAVQRTRAWMRTVTNGELRDELGASFEPDRENSDRLARWRARQPFQHPLHWAAFGLTGT
jgi:hypothetical protein